MKKFIMVALAIGIGLSVPVVMLEIFFRLLPVSGDEKTQPVNSGNPYIHLEPNRDVTWSIGWDFHIVAKKHVNNYGYTSDYDYTRNDKRPNLAVIGDSFVQAIQVKNHQTMHGVLSERIAKQGSVYGIGINGAPLSQYLAFSRFAYQELSVDALTFIIIANDFDESLLKYKRAPGFHYFIENEGGCCDLQRIDWLGKSLMGKVANYSALIRYLLVNVGIDRSKINWIWKGTKSTVKTKFVGNVAAQVEENRLEDSMLSVDEFFRLLPEYSKLKTDKIQFVIDGMRPNLYSADGMVDAEGSYFDKMRRYFMQKARDLGYEVIDMQPVFMQHYTDTGEQLEFYPVDAHWNMLGHKLVADEIQSSKMFRKVFGANENRGLNN